MADAMKSINIDLVSEFTNKVDAQIQELTEQINNAAVMCTNASSEVGDCWSLLVEAKAVMEKIKNNTAGLEETMEALKKAVQVYEEQMIEADSSGSVGGVFDID